MWCCYTTFIHFYSRLEYVKSTALTKNVIYHYFVKFPEISFH